MTPVDNQDKRVEPVSDDQSQLTLSERDFAAFVEAINSPPAKPADGLLKAVHDYESRIQSAKSDEI